MRGLEVAAVIRDEGVSAFKHLDKRPGGAELLELIRAGKASHVVVLKPDRAFRNAADALAQTERWDRAGVALHLVDTLACVVATGSDSTKGRNCARCVCSANDIEALFLERTKAGSES